ncbi:pyridoxal 5'-phosphate synthase glutaminase subunit PdxT [Dehalococcoidia bacterium]|nr:pyridoxal 5'-phosphate synthase glutaminase subunit PdxT [Dehalococcoidia bacterium]MCL0051001.1 pyridoxal 5'-phosphate synthase glutaminase subunit PdxT [Dehalococcoidia bacterium]MCL0064962.1 pyridoxal 5'-phosphate synthase glutaminase subunit PdxT [Dehalococcoidia bacterium]MCL0095756.1 pyridoxal 5'-phosphate synthase glutaminase subunit PdxT [Dehalococcoidia bacterium]MCL0099238.1 pyridoxal 5'-phosphate synthase glutaminase subunit PdxT [Dehalococcoidia bacterium]
MKRIGVLALQGAFAEHIVMLRRRGAEAVPVRLPEELEGLDGLVIPGGESTTIGKLMHLYGFNASLQRLLADRFPVLGTCAGMILLAKQVIGLNGYSLGAIDIKVRRNAFGRQVDSFEADIQIPVLGDPLYRAVFIRAPGIEHVGPGVEVLARLPDGKPVAAREGNTVVAAFHPELTGDSRFHNYFLSLVD